MNRCFASIFIICCISVPAPAQSTQTTTTSSPTGRTATQPAGARNGGVVKRPDVVKGWELTDEERISRRVRGAGHVRGESTPGKSDGYHEAVDGRVNPELFMPYELFDHLLLGLSSDGSMAARFRPRFDARVRTFGYEQSKFWEALSSAALPYLRAREDHEQHHRRTTTFQLPDGRKSIVTINRDDCAARLEALEKARRALGGAEFDRFLYSMIAPTYQHSEGGSAPDRAAQLRYMAKGCK